MEKHATVVSFLLDETGSMHSIKDDTVGGFNAYLETLQHDDADIVFSLVSFNSADTRRRYVAQPIEQVAPLTADTYHPTASTPLIDAAVTIINATSDAVKTRDGDPNVVIVVQTDGHENASVEHNRADLEALIEAKQAAGWEFVFLGAGLDAFAAARGAGLRLDAKKVVAYSRSRSREVFAATAENLRDYVRSGRGETLDYRLDQREGVEDTHTEQYLDPSATPPNTSAREEQPRGAAVDDRDLTAS